MAINVLRGGRASRDAASGFAIGQPDSEIFNCPNCARPLAVGTRRCPNCRSLLVLGVPGAKAMTFIVLGIGIGLLAGGGVIGAVAMSRPVEVRQVIVPAPTLTPTAAPTAAPVATPVPIDPSALTPTSIAALRATSAVNGRLASLVGPLNVQLATSPVDTSEVARILRRVSFEAGTASAFVAPLGRWTQATALSDDLDKVYGDLRSTAQDALQVTLHNDAAYEGAGQRVLDILARLQTLDGTERSLASAAGVELPQLVDAGG